MVKRPQFSGSIPTITRAYENDPRTKLAQAATALGTSNDALVSGNWAIPQGLARVAQAITGALIDKQQQKKYAGREQEYMDAMRGALPADAPVTTDPMAAAATALGGPSPAPPVVSAPEVPSGVPSPVPAPPAMRQSPSPAPASGPMGAPATAPAPQGPGALPAPPTPYGAPPVMGPGSGITVPTMEAVPELRQAPATAPVAPALPKRATSASMEYAKRLINSGNPDLAVLGETFLAKGLGETTDIARDTATQEFQQGQTGYEAQLRDYGDARKTDREAVVQERRDVLSRNFDRYQTYTGQRFTGAQNDKNRALELELAKMREAGDWERTKYSVKAQLLMKKLEKNPYYDTPTGLKMREQANNAVNANEILKAKIDKFLSLNERVSTGGVAGRVPFRGDFDSDFATMDSLAKETTIEKLGGLGVAISDGDRQFVESSGLNMTKPLDGNRQVGQVLKAALDRKSERELAFGDAQANGITQRTFAREWKRYINEEPIVRYDKNKTAYIPKEIISFEEWQQIKDKPAVR